ncbi:MAG: DUF433 domain-containing protein [Anaerolineae bacterium]
MATKTLDRHIEITAGVVGGKPRIAGHRITVQNIVIWHEWLGQSADEIATEYGLTLADVYAALAYYYDHQSEIDTAMRERDAWVEALRQQIPSKVAQKLHEPKN